MPSRGKESQKRRTMLFFKDKRDWKARLGQAGNASRIEVPVYETTSKDKRDNKKLELKARKVLRHKELVRGQAAMKIRELKLRKEPSEKDESNVLKEAKR